MTLSPGGGRFWRMSAVLFGLSVAVAAVLLSLEHSERTEVQDKDAINSLLYAIMK